MKHLKLTQEEMSFPFPNKFGNQVAFIQNEDGVFVGCIGMEVSLDCMAAIEYV